MNKALLLIIFLLPVFVFSQSVGIGTNAPDASALLQVESTSKGLLIPRMTDAQMNAIVSPANGLLVFNTTDNSLYMRRSTGWVNLNASVSEGWSITGNAGIDTATNFIGTTDLEAILFKVNGKKAGLLEDTLVPHNGNISFGLGALASNQTGNKNVAIGNLSMNLSNSATNNTALGFAALRRSNGTDNVGIGDSTLFANQNGDFNTAVGSKAMYLNITGSLNTAIGTTVLYNNTIGARNTAVGTSALAGNRAGNENVAIGYRSLYSLYNGSNNVVIGDSAAFNLNNSPAFISNNNVIIGSKAMYGASYGTSNVVIGDSAGFGLNGINNIYIGNAAGPSAAITSNDKLIIDNKSGFNGSFIYGDMNADSLRINADANITGYTRLGARSEQAPSIKMKKLTATSAATQTGSVTVAHGLDRDKIIGIQVLLSYVAGAADIPASYLDVPGYEYNWQVNNTNVWILNKNGNSANILSKPIKILITYEE